MLKHRQIFAPYFLTSSAVIQKSHTPSCIDLLIGFTSLNDPGYNCHSGGVQFFLIPRCLSGNLDVCACPCGKWLWIITQRREQLQAETFSVPPGATRRHTRTNQTAVAGNNCISSSNNPHHRPPKRIDINRDVLPGSLESDYNLTELGITRYGIQSSTCVPKKIRSIKLREGRLRLERQHSAALWMSGI